MRLFLFVLLILFISELAAQEVKSHLAISEEKQTRLSHRFDIAVQDVDHDGSNNGLIGGLSVEYIISYKLDRLLNLGFGLGYQRLDVLDQGSLPYFLSVTGYILDSRITPYYSVKIGKTVIRSRNGADQWESDLSYEDTWLIHPEIGLKITKNARMGIGYRVNQYRENIAFRFENRLREIKLQRWTLNYSILF